MIQVGGRQLSICFAQGHDPLAQQTPHRLPHPVRIFETACRSLLRESPSILPPPMALGLLTELLPLDVFSLITPFLGDAEAARLLLAESRLFRCFWRDLRVLSRLQRKTGRLGSLLKYREATCLFSRSAAVKEAQTWWQRRRLAVWVREVVEDSRVLSEGRVHHVNFSYSTTASLVQLPLPSCPSYCTSEMAKAAFFCPTTEASWELFVGCRDCCQRRFNTTPRPFWESLYVADLDKGPYRLTSIWDLPD